MTFLTYYDIIMIWIMGEIESFMLTQKICLNLHPSGMVWAHSQSYKAFEN